MADEQQNPGDRSPPIKQPDEFIRDLVSLLRIKATDRELVDILDAHMLKKDLSENAVEEAAAAIWELSLIHI